MPGWNTIAKWALRGLPVIVLVVMLAIAYKTGSNSGAAGVQADWNTAKLRHAEELAELKERVAQNEATHRRESQVYADRLADAERSHLQSLADLRSGYADRLLDSERRASAYERMSEAGAVGRANLASHAAQLDRSLEQGRLLVGELRSAVEQRDSQLRTLGEQLQADRRLINGTE